MWKSKAYKLNSEKVELSNIKELNEWNNMLRDVDAEATKGAERFEKAEAVARDAWNFFMKVRNSINSKWTGSLAVLRDFEKNAKALGIDNPSSIPEYKELKKKSDFAKSVVKELDTYKKPFPF